jgi:hypothetical protein
MLPTCDNAGRRRVLPAETAAAGSNWLVVLLPPKRTVLSNLVSDSRVNRQMKGWRQHLLQIGASSDLRSFDAFSFLIDRALRPSLLALEAALFLFGLIGPRSP